MTDNRKNLFTDEGYRRSVWKDIVAGIDRQEKVKPMSFAWIKYAAAMIIIASTAVAVLSIKTKKPVPVAASHIRVVNPTAKNYRAMLPDGSKIILYPNSEIVYRQPFAVSERNVSLQGKAMFDVAKNKTLPFRVHSKQVVTTALGTSFTIVTDSLPGEVNVFLHSGKVMIEQEGNKSQQVYLTPGQNLSWNINSGSSIVRKPGLIKPVSPVKKQITKAARNFTLVFDQEPLPGVLKKISSGFAISLNYYPREFDSLYFSGTIKSADKPVRVLERIAALYDLTVTEDKKGFRIRKN